MKKNGKKNQNKRKQIWSVILFILAVCFILFTRTPLYEELKAKVLEKTETLLNKAQDFTEEHLPLQDFTSSSDKEASESETAETKESKTSESAEALKNKGTPVTAEASDTFREDNRTVTSPAQSSVLLQDGKQTFSSPSQPLNQKEKETDSTAVNNEPDSSSEKNQTDTASEKISLSSIESLEIPLCSATVSGENSATHEVHTYSGFTLCYREEYEQAEWVAYSLTREELVKVIDRTDDFRADTKISTGSATPKDYTKSGYDRGHLAPAADMEWSEVSCRESFLMSNMSPQAPQLNRGLWKNLEEKVREWADFYGEVFVVTGPVLEKNPDEYKSIGTNKVSVPEYYYKVLLAQAEDENNSITSIAFILPNEKCTEELDYYAVTVDEAEKRTGLDFFSLLPDSVENRTESEKQLSYWK